MEYLIWTDGAIKGHIDKKDPIGGVGFVVNDEDGEFTNTFVGPFDGGGDIVTNNALELAAVVLAINSIESRESAELVIHSDSAYVVNNYNMRLTNWARNGFKKTDGTTIANEYLWKALAKLAKTCKRLQLSKVKGHSGDEGNELADRLATEGKESDGPRINLKQFILEQVGVEEQTFEEFRNELDSDEGEENSPEGPPAEYVPTPDASGKMPKFLSEFDSVKAFLQRVVNEEEEYVHWRGNRTAIVRKKETKYQGEIGEFIFRSVYNNESSFEKKNKRTEDCWVLEPTSLALKRRMHPEENERFKAEDGIFREPKQVEPFLEGMGTRLSPTPGVYNSLPNLPDDILNAPADDVFIYWRWEKEGESGGRSVPSDKYPVKRLECIRVCHRRDDGVKKFNTWTMYEGDIWKVREPEDYHRLYGLAELQQQPAITRLFIHEGEKTCREVRRKIADGELVYPFDEFFGGRGVYHIGWGFGALTPNKVMWSKLVRICERMKIREVVVIPDNDDDGRDVLRPFAKSFALSKVRCHWFDVSGLGVDEGWDFADPLPSKNWKAFKDSDSIVRIWHGKEPEECLTEMTWATSEYFKEDGSIGYKITRKFLRRYALVEDLNYFFDSNNPNLSMRKEHLNAITGAYSDVENVARLFYKSNIMNVKSLAFRPDKPSGLLKLSGENGNTLNQYIDRRAPPVEGDVEPFLEFIRFIVPDEEERFELLRWLATFFKYPGRKVTYGCLLVSKTQGVGKSLLISFLVKYVTEKMAAEPSDTVLTDSNFNGFLRNKLLVACHEIYADQNYRAIDKLKTILTEKRIMINEKYGPEYEADNYAKVFCCSNSLTALAVTNEDRRWLIIHAMEKKIDPSMVTRIIEFRDRMQGVQRLRHYFENVWEHEWSGSLFNEEDYDKELYSFESKIGCSMEEMKEQVNSGNRSVYIRESDNAPLTQSKRRMIEDNTSAWVSDLEEILEVLEDKEVTTYTDLKTIYGYWTKSKLPKSNRVYEEIENLKGYIRGKEKNERMRIPIGTRDQMKVLISRDAGILKIGKKEYKDQGWSYLPVSVLKRRLGLTEDEDLRPM